QYEDQETGLHYNRHRYYDPARGQYLSADPLGTPDGPNGYAYVRFNPLRYVDPDGLVLFAFDGTGNSDKNDDPAMKGNSFSNVVSFMNAYDDGSSRYVTGVGTLHSDGHYADIVPADYARGKPLAIATPLDPLYVNDMGGNYSGPARIDRMMLYLRDEAELFVNDEVMDIDIVGFSRGAAQARDFANRITSSESIMQIDGKTFYKYKNREGAERCQWVNFRFMGLWDTVLSTNYSGQSYMLGIPPEFKYVAQAVALNEYRSDNLLEFAQRNTKPHSMHWGGFPLESIGNLESKPGQIRIERGFLGAHADVGGGYGKDKDGNDENQLALIALNWMVKQAEDAGVKMKTEEIILPIGNPVLHDPSSNMVYGNPNGWSSMYSPRGNEELSLSPITYFGPPEERVVNGAAMGNTTMTMGFSNDSMVNADTHQFITFRPRTMEDLGKGGPLDARRIHS
ncbi:MAG: hypothetical protein EON54_22200, partial [Alcaligenaceae bacterium]